MKHAFEKAGLKKEDMEFHAHVERYFKSGGEYERGLAIYNQAAEKLGKVGHFSSAQEGLTSSADLSHPMPEGQVFRVHQDQVMCADGLPMLSEDHGGFPQQGRCHNVPTEPPLPSDGQTVHIQQDHAISATARPRLPEGQYAGVQQDHMICANGQSKASGEANKPVPAKVLASLPPARDPDEKFRQALLKDRIQNASIWLELNKTSDGRPWAKVCPYEFPAMKRDARYVHYIENICGPFNQKQMNMPLSQLMTSHLQEKLAARVKLMEGRRA